MSPDLIISHPRVGKLNATTEDTGAQYAKNVKVDAPSTYV